MECKFYIKKFKNEFFSIIEFSNGALNISKCRSYDCAKIELKELKELWSNKNNRPNLFKDWSQDYIATNLYFDIREYIRGINAKKR